jgi:hypothetical protein
VNTDKKDVLVWTQPLVQQELSPRQTDLRNSSTITSSKDILMGYCCATFNPFYEAQP